MNSALPPGTQDTVGGEPATHAQQPADRGVPPQFVFALARVIDRYFSEGERSTITLSKIDAKALADFALATPAPRGCGEPVGDNGAAEMRERCAVMSHGQYSSQALSDVAAERLRQIEKEGWSFDHDDQHEDGSLADAAACYAATRSVFKAEQYAGTGYELYTAYEPLWPKSWADCWWRPKKSRRRRLIVAAALIIAEIERLDRSSSLPSTDCRP